jgi:hypothetical protein
MGSVTVKPILEMVPTMLKNPGTGELDVHKIILMGAKIAGECYNSAGWAKLSKESLEHTEGRVAQTLGGSDGVGSEHFTPYEHVNLTFEITAPKIIMMILNNEKQMDTSEKSARYTKFRAENGVDAREKELYDKWVKIMRPLIAKQYPFKCDPNSDEDVAKRDTWILKKAQENARYLTSVFTTTKMIHTLPWAQLCRICGWMREFVQRSNLNKFERKVAPYLTEFVAEIDKLGLLDERCMNNRKSRRLSLFTNRTVATYFSDSYSYSYTGSFAELAQAHRHRTISYSMIPPRDDAEPSFFVPPILNTTDMKIDGMSLADAWLDDCVSLAENYPQGQMVLINELGTLENFVLKAKERLCSAAQLEIARQTEKALKTGCGISSTWNERFKGWHGARCQSGEYACAHPCGWSEAVNLTRVI